MKEILVSTLNTHRNRKETKGKSYTHINDRKYEFESKLWNYKKKNIHSSQAKKKEHTKCN